MDHCLLGVDILSIISGLATKQVDYTNDVLLQADMKEDVYVVICHSIFTVTVIRMEIMFSNSTRVFMDCNRPQITDMINTLRTEFTLELEDKMTTFILVIKVK